MDLSNLKVRKINKYSYVLSTVDNIDLTINIPKLYISFGVEYFKNKMIINAELLDYNTDNLNYNTIPILKQINSFFAKPNDFIQKITKDKIYYSFLKLDKYNKLILRTCIDKIPNDDIKGKFCSCNITLKNLWTNNTNYGVTILMNNIEIVC